MTDRARLASRTALAVGPGVSLVNMAAGGIVAAYFFLVLLPSRVHGQLPHRLLLDWVALGAYVAASFVAVLVVSRRMFQPVRTWVAGGGTPDAEQARYAVRYPLRQALVHTAVWTIGVAVFVPLSVPFSPRLAMDVGAAISLASLSTFALSYLLVERVMRPVASLALSSHRLGPDTSPGVGTRLLLAWGLGTGVPLLGIAIDVLDHRPGDPPLHPGALVSIVAIGLVSGAAVMHLAAGSVTDPLEAVTTALAEVERGRIDVEVPVYDGSEVGRLQHGFNAMVAGLRERRALQDLFGRQVGHDVARHTMERGVSLGGEVVDASVLFVDVIASTRLSAERPPDEVLAVLNEFFGTVVRVVRECGGFVNKFEGDAALCVFGAPMRRSDHARCALLAARQLSRALAGVDLQAAIGVSTGRVVAGNVGAHERFEYTVVGDAVNEAARLTDLAKSRPGRVLVSADVVERAGAPESGHWQLGGSVRLRGRPDETRLAVPA